MLHIDAATDAALAQLVENDHGMLALGISSRLRVDRIITVRQHCYVP